MVDVGAMGAMVAFTMGSSCDGSIGLCNTTGATLPIGLGAKAGVCGECKVLTLCAGGLIFGITDGVPNTVCFLCAGVAGEKSDCLALDTLFLVTEWATDRVEVGCVTVVFATVLTLFITAFLGSY